MKIIKLDGRRKYYYTFYVMSYASGGITPIRTITIRHYTVDNARHLAVSHIVKGEYLSSYYNISLKG